MSTMFQILDAVYFLHSKGYIHRNICVENIFTFNSGTKVKISNFKHADFSKNSSSDAFFSDVIQAPEYLSPEIVSGLPYRGITQDAWSVGIVLSFLISGRYLWDMAMDKNYVNFVIFKQDGSPFKVVRSKLLKDLLAMFLNVNPHKRSSVFGVVMSYIGVRNLKKWNNK